MIVGLLRVKNVGKWITRLLTQMDKICDKILILNDGSTDETLLNITKFCDQHQHIWKDPFKVSRRNQDIYPNGGRDRIMLHKWAEEFNPTWIVSPDGDELWEEGKEEDLRDLLLNTPDYIEAWKFPFFYLWDNENEYREDGSYKNVTAIRAFRYDKDELPKDTPSHSMPYPYGIVKRSRIKESVIRMKHFGYMEEDERIRRYNYYSKRDINPGEAGAGSPDYGHIISPEGLVLKKWGEWGDAFKRIYIRAEGNGVIDYDNYDLTTGVPLDKYRDKSVSEVMIKDLFEEFDSRDRIIVFRELHRVIKTMGTLEIMTKHPFAIVKEELKVSFFDNMVDVSKNSNQRYIFCTNGA